MGMNQRELATRMGRPIKTINEIIKGKNAITAETAIQLEHVLGISSQFWLNLEAIYGLAKARVAEIKVLESEARHVELYDYNDLANHNLVKKTRNKSERAFELLQYFGVASLSNVELAPTVRYRRDTNRRASRHALTAWLRFGEKIASSSTSGCWNRALFIEKLQAARTSTINGPDNFIRSMKELFSECGVAVVFVPHLKQTYANGATRWLSPTKALIQLSIRNRYWDIFCFTFFHEAAHLLLHGKREKFVDVDNAAQTDREAQANEWAANFLIPPREYCEFIDAGDFRHSAIREFARHIGVSEALVAGRLAHDDRVRWQTIARLRSKLAWSHE